MYLHVCLYVYLECILLIIERLHVLSGLTRPYGVGVIRGSTPTAQVGVMTQYLKYLLFISYYLFFLSLGLLGL